MTCKFFTYDTKYKANIGNLPKDYLKKTKLETVSTLTVTVTSASKPADVYDILIHG